MVTHEIPNAFKYVVNQYQIQFILVVCTYIVKVMSAV